MTAVDESPVVRSDTASMAEGVRFPTPPTFESVEAERAHRKQSLADALNILGELRLAEGVAGHITVRDPEFTDRFWVNPFGVSFKLVRPEDLLCVDHDGAIVEGNRPLNNAAFAIHGAIHAARPDVIAACHTHAMYSKTFSALGIPLAMITQDHCQFYDDVALHADSGGAVVTGIEDGHKLAQSLGDKKALLHQNHGVITTGGSVDSAAWWFIALERACQSQLVAMAAGEPKIIPDEYVRYSYDQTGYDLAGWFQFQSIKQEHGKSAP